MTEDEALRASMAYYEDIEDPENFHPSRPEMLRYAVREAQHRLKAESDILGAVAALPDPILFFLYPEILPLVAHPWTLSKRELDKAVSSFMREVSKQEVTMGEAELRALMALVRTLPIGWLVRPRAARKKKDI